MLEQTFEMIKQWCALWRVKILIVTLQVNTEYPLYIESFMMSLKY